MNKYVVVFVTAAAFLFGWCYIDAEGSWTGQSNKIKLKQCLMFIIVLLQPFAALWCTRICMYAFINTKWTKKISGKYFCLGGWWNTRDKRKRRKKINWIFRLVRFLNGSLGFYSCLISALLQKINLSMRWKKDIGVEKTSREREREWKKTRNTNTLEQNELN